MDLFSGALTVVAFPPQKVELIGSGKTVKFIRKPPEMAFGTSGSCNCDGLKNTVLHVKYHALANVVQFPSKTHTWLGSQGEGLEDTTTHRRRPPPQQSIWKRTPPTDERNLWLLVVTFRNLTGYLVGL